MTADRGPMEAAASDDLAEAVRRLVGGDHDAIARVRAVLDTLEAHGAVGDGIAASIAEGDGLWLAVPGDGGDAITSGRWRDQLLSVRSTHV